MGLANNIITHPKDIVEKHTIAQEQFAKKNKVSKIVYLRQYIFVINHRREKII